MFHPNYTYINKTVTDFDARPILQTIYDQGRLVYQQPELADIKSRCSENLENLWPEYKRDLNPQKYPVDLSQKLWDNKMNLIKKVHEYVKKIDYDNK